MTVYSSAIRGDIETRDRLPANLVVPQAVSTTLVAGSIVYIDGANGVKVAPVNGSISANRLFFCKEGQTSTSVLGEKMCTLYKCGHIVVGYCGGAIVVGDYAKQGETTGNEGQFEAWGALTISLGATYVEAAVNLEVTRLQTNENKRLAIYLGHPGEGIENANKPTDAVDTALGRFLLI